MPAFPLVLAKRYSDEAAVVDVYLYVVLVSLSPLKKNADEADLIVVCLQLKAPVAKPLKVKPVGGESHRSSIENILIGSLLDKDYNGLSPQR
jgi:hypothetical protein